MIPKFPAFKNLELSDKAAVESFTRGFFPYSDFNFVSMWCWNTEGDLAISDLNGNLVVKFRDYLTKKPFYSYIGSTALPETIRTLSHFSVSQGLESKLALVPEESATVEHHGLARVPDQDNFDYVYDMREYVACEGKTYETQRNQISRFERNHPGCRIEVLDSLDSVKNKLVRLEQLWKINKLLQGKASDFKNESDALERIFDLSDAQLIAVCIYVNGRIAGFCISELIEGSNFAVAHFAKANITFPGIYSYMFRETCKALIARGKQYLNYEQDLGLTQLRQAKTAFRPVRFLKKYSVTLGE